MHFTTSKTRKLLFAPLVAITKWIGMTSPETLVRMRYFARFHKKLNLVNPQTLNEKILYLSLRTDTTQWTRLADKWAVREYVKECGLDEILVPNLGHWNSSDEIDLSLLPNSFVLKTTHGSGDILIVHDKAKITKEDIVTFFNPFLKQQYGALEGARHYLRIKPALVAEELISDDEYSSKYSSSLIDYKFWCFNGIPKYAYVITNRNNDGIDSMLYDMDWCSHPNFLRFDGEHRIGEKIPKPLHFEYMVDVAMKLAANIPCVRVDLYNTEGHVYFGEMTFTSLGGMMTYFTEEFQMLAGHLITINNNE